MTTSLKIVCDADNKGEMEFLEVLCTEVVTALVKLGIHYNVWVTPTMTEINREDFLGVLKPHHTLWRRLVIIIHKIIYFSFTVLDIYNKYIYIFFTGDGNLWGIVWSTVLADNYDTSVRWKAVRGSFTQHVLMRILPRNIIVHGHLCLKFLMLHLITTLR